MNLVDWFKGMVASRRGEEVVDPLMDTHPPSRALKRILLLCLRCIDMDANKRPKMGQIVHMLETDEFPYRAVSLPLWCFILQYIFYLHYWLGPLIYWCILWLMCSVLT